MSPLLLITAAAAQAAQEPPARDDPIVVTGRGLEDAVGEEVYDTVTIGRERLTGAASTRIEELLRDVPGFQLFRRSDSRSANPTSQGATLRALGGNASSRALLVLDGVPQSDPFGGWVSWPAYDPRRLGRVRVTRGGGSGANGPGALAGTIALESATPDQIAGVRGELAYGSRDSIDGFAGVGLGLGAGFLAASASYARGDGFVPVIEEQRGPVDRASPYEQASLALRGVAPVGDRVELQASGLWFSDERERGTALSGIRTTGADAAVRLVGPRWSALGYVQTRDFVNSFASANDARTQVDRVALQYAVPSTGLGARFEYRPALGATELRIGGDWRRTSGSTNEFYSYQAGVATRRREAGGRTDTLGAFAEAAREVGDFTLSAGGRIDRWWINEGRLDERLLAGGVLTDQRFGDRSGWEPTGRAGLAWRAAGAVTLRAAAYAGWRLPTLNELYRPFRVGADATAANAALEPERLKGIEAGIEYRPLATLRGSVTIFANRLDEAIANVTLAQGPGLFPGVGFVGAAGEYRQRRNLDAIVARGIEVDGEARIGAWTLQAGYAFVDAEVSADGPAAPLDGLRPAQTPRHTASATLAWRGFGGAAASASLRYVSAQFEDDLNQQRLPDALTLDLAGSVPVGPRLRLEARAENLTDERVVAGISGAGIVERATPRTLWLGLRVATP